MKDADPQIRVQSIRAAETLLKAGDKTFIADMQAASADENVHVKLQSVLTSKLHKFPQWKENATQVIMHSTSKGLKEIGSALLATGPTISQNFTPQQRKQLGDGMKYYQEVCFACHGPDGQGTPIPGSKGLTLAPPLAGSKTVRQGDAMLRVLLNGLEGPIEGKTYESQMIPQNTNSDQWLADITSYVRNAFGNCGEIVDAKQVKALRKEIGSRTKPWTIEELRAMSPQPIAERKSWKLTSSHNPEKLALMIDNDPATRWDTKIQQAPGMWLQIDLPAPTAIVGIELECAASANDSPAQFEAQSSDDGKTWKTIAKGQGTPGFTSINLPTVKSQHLRILQKATKPGKYWSIHELNLLAPVKK
jgi:mono/diheme cytochrome c family protein